MPVALAFSDDMPELEALIAVKREEWQRVAHSIATEAGAMGELVMKGQIKKAGLIGVTGLLRNQVTSSVGLEGDAVITWIRSEAPYAQTMDEGRRPGATQPPTGPLALWAKRKILPKSQPIWFSRYLKGKKGKAKGDGMKRALAAFAYVIARSIKKKGIKGRHYVDKTAKILTKRLPKLIDTHLREFVNRDR